MSTDPVGKRGDAEWVARNDRLKASRYDPRFVAPKYRAVPDGKELYAQSKRGEERDGADFDRILEDDEVDVRAAFRRMLGYGKPAVSESLEDK